MSKPTELLHQLGQRLWLDNITRDLLDKGTLHHYVQELSVTGLTSNPSIFDLAITGSTAYDAGIREKAARGLDDEGILVELALEDLRRAADIFHPLYLASKSQDGWVSMEVSPLLASDAAGTLRAARAIFAQAQRPNLFIKIPGTPESIPAIEEAIFAGIPVNVTLLFSCAQYLAAAEAYLRGIERRLAKGLSPAVISVASVFVSRWDAAVSKQVSADLQNQLGMAVCGETLAAWRALMSSERWQPLAEAGAVPQRLLWASTGTKDPAASDTLYVEALAYPDTVNTLPEKTLLAFADHGQVGMAMAADGVEAKAVLERFKLAGINIDELAGQLQEDGARAFVKSWQHLLQGIGEKRQQLL